MPLPPKYSPITHVLFDMDGLLLNTEELYTVAFQSYVAQFGKDYTYDLKLKLMGTQAHETAAKIIEELELPVTVDTFFIETQKRFEKLFPDCKLMPGAFRLLKHLCTHDIPIGLATSSTRKSYELKINKCHKSFMSLIPYKTFGSDPEVKRGKPNPDIFLVAAAKFPDKPKPAEILVFEDSVNGVKAAKAAGMQVVMVPDPKLDRKLTKEATVVINSLHEFRPEEFGLPPFLDDVEIVEVHTPRSSRHSLQTTPSGHKRS